MDVLEFFIVFRHRQVIQIQFVHALFWEITLRQSLRDFATSVGAEVEADYHVALLDIAHRSTWRIRQDDWVDEFVRHTRCIAIFNRFQNVSWRISFAVYHRFVGQSHALPAIIAVHRVVTTRYWRDLRVGF